MLVGPDLYEKVYSNLREEVQTSEQKKVLVFVATDTCDSVCAVKTLQVMPPAMHVFCNTQKPSIPSPAMLKHICTAAAASAAVHFSSPQHSFCDLPSLTVYRGTGALQQVAK